MANLRRRAESPVMDRSNFELKRKPVATLRTRISYYDIPYSSKFWTYREADAKYCEASVRENKGGGHH